MTLIAHLRTLLGYVSLVALQVGSMIWGWGLTPKSWLAILGLGVVMPAITRWWLIEESVDMQILADKKLKERA